MLSLTLRVALLTLIMTCLLIVLSIQLGNVSQTSTLLYESTTEDLILWDSGYNQQFIIPQPQPETQLQLNIYNYNIAPDGEAVLFTTNESVRVADAFEYSHNVYLASRLGSPPTRIVQVTSDRGLNGNVITTRWSPNGRYIGVMVTSFIETSLSIYHADGTLITTYEPPHTIDEANPEEFVPQLFFQRSSLLWSADDETMYLLGLGWGSVTILSLEAMPDAQIQLEAQTSIAIEFNFNTNDNNIYLLPSPTQPKALIHDGNEGVVWYVNLMTGEAYILEQLSVTANTVSVNWSEDGRRIGWATYDENNQRTQLFTMTTTDFEPTQWILPTMAQQRRILNVWLPENSMQVMIRLASGSSQMQIICRGTSNTILTCAEYQVSARFWQHMLP